MKRHIGFVIALFLIFSPCIAWSQGDITGDGRVDACDLLQMLSDNTLGSQLHPFMLVKQWQSEQITDTPTSTATKIPQETPTETPSDTPTESPTETPTFTATETPTSTMTPTATETPISGPWVGTYEETKNTEGPLVDGYLVLEINQNGTDVSVTVRPENYVLTGTRNGDLVSVSGKDRDNNIVTIEGTLTDEGSHGTFSVVGSGEEHRGTIEIAPAGERVDCAGIWTGSFEDRYDSRRHEVYGYYLLELSQSGNRLTAKLLVDDYSLTGYLEGNIFVLILDDLTVSGEINGDQIESIHLEIESDRFCWGTMSASKSDGSAVNGAGSWTIKYRQRQPYLDSLETIPVTATQSGNSYTLRIPNESGGTSKLTGRIYDDTFVVHGRVDGDDLRIDGVITGNKNVGTVEGDASGWWFWGTYSGSR